MVGLVAEEPVVIVVAVPLLLQLLQVVSLVTGVAQLSRSNRSLRDQTQLRKPKTTELIKAQLSRSVHN